jgi:hypothetical protein
LPVFWPQGFGRFVNLISPVALTIAPLQSVYDGTKNAVRDFRGRAGKRSTGCAMPGCQRICVVRTFA